MDLVILTHAPTLAVLYGSTLIFRTLRVGFPTAEVSVFDNGSCPEALAAIRAQAHAAGCQFASLDTPCAHADFLRWVLMVSPMESVVIADPDLMFWEPVEGWDFGDALLAGRYIPPFEDPYHGSPMAARLHPSLLFAPDLKRLRGRVAELETRYPRAELFKPFQAPGEHGWQGWDTLAGLYGALRGDCAAFGAAELDGYDHLFAGTHWPSVAARFPEGTRMAAWHGIAQGDDWPSLRGIWREQERYFRDTATSGDPLERFCRWWLKHKPLALPYAPAVTTFDGQVVGTVLFREDCFQVQLFLAAPGARVPEHTHPQVDSILLYLGGQLAFNVDGEDFTRLEWLKDQDGLCSEAGWSYRLRPGTRHGFQVGEYGGVFLNIEQWPGEPDCVSRDWAFVASGETRRNYP